MPSALQLADQTRGLVWLTLALATACSNPAASPTSPVAPARPPEAALTPDEPAPAESRSLPPGRDVTFSQEFKTVSKVRQLEIIEDIAGRLVSEDDLVNHVEQTFRDELPPRVLEATGKMLIGLGVVPNDFDYHAAMLELLHGNLAGLYDPKLDAMLIRDDLEDSESLETLYHELVHALQDQHYNLNAFGSWKPDATDASSAVSCLAEGDAMSAMFDAMLTHAARGDDAPAMDALDLPLEQIIASMDESAENAGDSIPAIVRRSLASSYTDGLRFVHALRAEGGWPAVDAAWRQRPDTTEQVLHLDKFRASEPPIDTSAILGPDASWTRTLTDIWGEQSIRLVFEEWLPADKAAVAAAGWGGDRIAVYEKGSAFAVSWHLIADDIASAQRYLETFAQASEKLGEELDEELGIKDGYEWSCALHPATSPWAIGRQGRHVVVLAGPISSTTTDAASCSDSRSWMRRAMTSLSQP